ncbi:MAG: rRNA small subunit methyltransferase I [Ignavibacteriae bacterium]|nr:MAG: rRNA small subunit methyltransferase I [Ignavibacteriota bacterium]
MAEEIINGALYIVSTPIGNLEDITLRALRILKSVDFIAAEDTRKTKILLNHYGIEKELISYYQFNELKRIPEIINKLKSGKSVAVVSDAGTPGISDPAYRLVKKAVEEEIKIIPIPGASALLSALVVSGLPTDSFVFEGFLPHKKGRKTKLEKLKSEERTIILYESPHRILKTLHEILETLGDRKITVAREITKKFEELMYGRVSDVIRQLETRTVQGEFVIVLSGNEN